MTDVRLEQTTPSTSGRLALRLVATVFLIAAAVGSLMADGDSADADARFVAESQAAMGKMMTAMERTPSGDVDADFAAMMIPHHVGAIETAQAELRAGRNEQLRRLAQEIIVTQQQEIAAMRLALPQRERARPDASAQGTAAVAAHDHDSNRANRNRADGNPANDNGASVSGANINDSSRNGASSVASADPVSHRDRVYAAEQFSNTVSVTDPASNTLLGVIRLGDPAPGNLSPLYRGQLLVHGMGFSPDHRTLAVVSIGSNSVTFIDTATNAVKHVTYVGRSPHEAFFTPDGKEVWVTVRGESHIAVLDGTTYAETARIPVPNGPGMQIFSPDGRYGYVCSSFTPETVVISVADHQIVGRVPQESPFCPNIAATPDGKQVWFTLKDVGKVTVFDARPPFNVLKTIETGPITNHVNFAYTAQGNFAYVTVGGLDQVQIFRIEDFAKVATVPVGKLPHGLWPSGDGSRMYVGLENADELIAIDTATQKVMATVPIGQAPQAVNYVPNAVPEDAGAGAGTQNLQPLGIAGQTIHLTLAPPGAASDSASPTSVSLFDQGLMQVLQASVTGLEPKRPYVLALSDRPDGAGVLEPLAAFTTNPAGSAIVNALGPIRRLVQEDARASRRYLVIAPGTVAQHGAPVQVQVQVPLPPPASPRSEAQAR